MLIYVLCTGFTRQFRGSLYIDGLGIHRFGIYPEDGPESRVCFVISSP
jgi:hypothetical protein